MRFGINLRMVLLLLPFLVFSGCVDRPSKSLVENSPIKQVDPHAYHSFNFGEYQPADTTGMVQKVDNFVVIFDPSASMTKTYEASGECVTCHFEFKDSDYLEEHTVKYGGRVFSERDDKPDTNSCSACHQDFFYSKFKFAKQLVECFNQSIPDLELVSVLRTIGSPVYSRLAHGPEPYDRMAYSISLRKIFDSDGASPLAPALKNVGKDLFNLPGKKAVIIISDGEDMDKREVVAAEELKARYGDDICIYTIHIGNDPSGKQIMDKIAIAGQCGLSIEGELLLAKTQMDNFVREIFLTRDRDSDGDGVDDLKDDCPETRPGLDVDENGCWKLSVPGNVLFDFDKYDLKPEGIKILDQVVALLKKHDFLDLQIRGHTDNAGSMAYNIILSRNRAQSGLNHIKERDISPQRLSISWHSFSMPVATNDTAEGRALNRRLEFKFKKRNN